ncbi:MAG: 23S rRNA (adenine(2030)-N(6))-methyltransferase RlmJ [Gammaproteobacteria bacterium]|nr:23S rRNA (adenine(2030)-N(6))-methyltransferase RlmJ [Gammaproteobacteria bacterium]
MLSYRHSFHAGNYADVLKHIVLIELLEYITKKEGGFDYIDTHAGAGMYDLQSEHATKLHEYQQGIAKLKQQDWPELATYFDILAKYNSDGKLDFYPGSPMITMHFLRGQDRSWLYELHPKDAEMLVNNMGRIKRARIMHQDGFKGLLSLLPPVSRRAVVLIDPSYEVKTDYNHVVDVVIEAYNTFPTGIYALWYPVVDRNHIATMQRRLVKSGIKKIVQFELGVTQDQFGTGMTASGMIVINPPWILHDKMATLLPKLKSVLGRDNTAFYKCEQLVGE